jgi:hypothetical protein
MEQSKAWMSVGLLLGVLLSACDRSSPVSADRATPFRSVEIDLGPLHRPLRQGVAQTCVSAIADAVLRVAGGGAPQEFRKAVPPAAPTIEFDLIEVSQGSVTFSADIVSDNATVLYGREVTEQIDAATFDIPIQVEPQAPVLQVCPSGVSLGLSNSFYFELQVSNRGDGTLTYQAESPDCDGRPCLDFFDSAVGSVEPGGVAVLPVHPLQMVSQPSVELRIRSPEGSVGVNVALEQVADLVVTSLEATGPPEFFGDDVGDIAGLVPVRVVVRNVGQVAAPVFKVHAEYTGSEASGLMPFAVAGQESTFYPFTAAPLEPGGEVTLEGGIGFPASAQGEVIRVRVMADSCSGDELALPYCRVAEFEEFNNLSQDLVVSIP